MFAPGAAKAKILDGSTGYVLLQNGLPEDEVFGKIWSAAAFVEEKYHGLVVDTHKHYLAVGATAITTNSYATQPTYYEKAFGSDFETVMLQHAELSARLAAKAKAEHVAAHPGAEVQVMGSLPPLVESHRPDIFSKALAERGEAYFRHHYQQLASALLKGGVDALLFETLNSWEEARLGLEAMMELSPAVPIAVSFEGSLRDEALKPQPHLAPEVLEKVLEYKNGKGLSNIVAVGFNCAPPEDIEKNLEVLRDAGMLKTLEENEVRMLVYANMHERAVYDEGFDVENIDASAVVVPDVPEAEARPKKRAKAIVRRKDLTECKDDPFSGYTKFTHRFVHEFGVSAVGGCCGCGPLGIKAIRCDLEGTPDTKTPTNTQTTTPGDARP
jgi:S-methylmethionine-dependent homocysteine/selenocysteine methylase